MTTAAVSSRPVRVAQVIQNLNYGGMERVLHGLIRQLAPRGFEIHLVVIEYLGRFAEGLEGVATFHQLPRMSRLSMVHPGRLADLFRQIGPDVVHSHGGVWLKAARAARLADIPVVVHTDHGRLDPVPLVDRIVDNAASRWTDAIIAVSDPLADVVRRSVAHDPNRVRVIVNGVDLEPFKRPTDRTTLRRELGIPLDSVIIGTIGRLEPVKNHALALRAFSAFKDTGGQGGPYLVIAGDGSQRQALESLAASLGIASQVKLLGWRDDADRLYGAFDLFTLSSTSEGTSISLLEAMGSGICPVVTDVGGNRAVLGPDLASLVVPDNDAAALGQAWKRLLDTPTLRGSLATVARQRAERGFSLEAMVDRYDHLYRELLEATIPTSGALSS